MGLSVAGPGWPAATLAAAVCLGGGCASRNALDLVSASQGAPALADGVDVDSVERLRRRHEVLATGIGIEATLWDGALVAVGVQRAEHAGGSPEHVRELAQHWTRQYVNGHTAFTVVVELANRNGPDDSDPLQDPASWQFTLDRGDQRAVPPRAVTLQGIDRFPSDAGGHHLRLAFAVVFDGDAVTLADSQGSPLALRVHVQTLQPGLSRRELGRWIAHRGAALHWWVRPAKA